MAAPLSVLIVDDEALARLRLRTLLGAVTQPALVIAGEAGSAEQAMALLRREPVDLLLLDVRMPGRGGLALAAALHELPRRPAVVFVSAHGEHALEAFDVEAVDYLTKPVRLERLQAALERVAARRAPLPAAGPVLVVSERGRLRRVPLAEVLYLRAEAKAVLLRTPGETIALDETLAELEQRLGAGFLRIHRNAIVARAAVRALEPRDDDEGWAVRLAPGDEWLAVSRRQLAAVREALGES
ncbi:LytR/AlgR family response regulator transcription factor [Rubrivivax gelatinosus]|uniref:LytTR family two component transcriptional regulator n=1 Tax=Rubrivivax gelatinosus TaxID=28068 RepID=A0A4R2M3Z7_RUBGE|nr:LytTR family DNA-binding domain-containing protein [Rubrivivax gelatinosus]MBK1688378.1 DNA-binding response regulator [Rubrivivax gelatinosus]TCP01889.1 LytTR family two component transcriptional regulator [Rubrivivax gelatinosus]